MLKEGWYGFYKEYIVHYWVFEDLELADYLLKHQEDKPRYIPEKDEFLKYVNEYYVDNESWMNVRRFMWDTFDNYKNASKGYEEIKDYITYNSGISELGSILDRHNLIFRSEEQFEEFVNLIMFAKTTLVFGKTTDTHLLSFLKFLQIAIKVIILLNFQHCKNQK